MKITFQFGGWKGPIISAPVHYVIGRHVRHPAHHIYDRCLLEIGSVESMGETGPVLGENFLRSAYLIYDVENRRIAIAQSKNTKDSNIEAIINDVDIPGMSTVLPLLPTTTNGGVAHITKPTTFVSRLCILVLGDVRWTRMGNFILPARDK